MKICILTDSTGCPRIAPKSDILDLEETYPYLIKKKFPNAIFWQLSLGNQTSNLLVSQARNYLLRWKPDFIIVGSGINDCRPEAISTELKNKILKNNIKYTFIKKLIKKIIYLPFLIKFFQKNRTTIKNFENTIYSLKRTFSNSRIIWLEISSDVKYEKLRPGVLIKKNLYNTLLKKHFSKNLIEIDDELNKKNLFTSDFHHFKKEGHKIIAEKIIFNIK